MHQKNDAVKIWYKSAGEDSLVSLMLKKCEDGVINQSLAAAKRCLQLMALNL